MKRMFLALTISALVGATSSAQTPQQCAKEWKAMNDMGLDLKLRPAPNWAEYLNQCVKGVSRRTQDEAAAARRGNGVTAAPAQTTTNNGMALSGHPNNQEAVQCVQSWIRPQIPIGPSVLDCGQFLQLEGVNIVDSRKNGGTTELIVEINLRAVQGIGAGGMVAQYCTGLNWGNDIPQNARVVLKKILSFEVFSTQAICKTNALAPLVQGNWYPQ